MRSTYLAPILLFACPLTAAAQNWPEGDVDLPVVRWRSVHQIANASAEQSGFRWAIPATISRRAYLGAEKPKPAAEVIRDLCTQTGLKAEKLNGVLIIHEPSERLKTLLDRSKELSAIVELGWLRDARAWPELARLAVGENEELALAAAQALRRLEGEKPLDWRLHGVSADDPEFRAIEDTIARWQVPLGLAFPECVTRKQVEKLAGSQYLPLREAAARLTPAVGENGRELAEKLAKDLSPLVRAAAERTLAAWAKPERAKGYFIRKASDGARQWWEPPAPDKKTAAAALANAKDHDTIWRLLGRRYTYEGVPEAIATMIAYGRSGAKWSNMSSRPLAEWCGGPEVVAWLKAEAARHSEYGGHQGWALWGLTALQDGEQLAESLRPALESRAYWASPPEYTAAYGAGIHVQDHLLARLETRGHWVCRALAYIGGPKATRTLIEQLKHKDPGVAIAAAKGLGDTSSLAAVEPLIAQLTEKDRLRRHWAVLGLMKIGGPDAARALTQLLKEEETRKDRLVRMAAVRALQEIGRTSPEAQQLIARAEAEDQALAPEYRPRNPRFDATFPVNTEVAVPEHKPSTFCSIGETRAAMDWANRLLFRYGGCTGCYSNEMFAFDVGTATWFPIRAADHFCDLLPEIRPNPGCSRGMTYDGVNKLVWIGQGIGSSTGPTQVSHNRRNGLAAYDDRVKAAWVELNAKNLGIMGVGQGTCVYDPEHNVILEPIRGVAYRYKEVPVGTRAKSIK